MGVGGHGGGGGGIRGSVKCGWAGGVKRWVLEVLVKGGWIGVGVKFNRQNSVALRCVAQIINSSEAYDMVALHCVALIIISRAGNRARDIIW